MNTHDYDLIVLGTGGAGLQVAMKCKQAGWNVAVVNEGPFGGTCAVRGCVPKKVLSGTAEIIDMNRRLGDIGILSEQPKMSWQELVNFKRTFTDPFPVNTEAALHDADIDVYIGSPRFTDKLTIKVNESTITAKKVHIAVGAKPAKLPIEGFEHFTNSDEFLELDKLPERIIFVGGGYVSFEFAHIATRFGAEVTILHADNSPLAMFDKDIIDTLLAASKEAGVEVVLDEMVKKIEKGEDEYTVSTKSGNTFSADLVVHGAGRPPAVADLNLEAADIEFDPHRGVIVDKHLRSVSNPDVYAAGDVAAAGPPLSPVAGFQGSIVADNLLGSEREQPNYLSTPSVIFTTPVAAKVGHLEAEAKENGIDFEVVLKDISEWFDSKRTGQKYAKSKILIEIPSKKIIGAHLIGNHAEDLINMFSLAIENGLTVDQLKAPLMAFPTASDDIRSMF